MHFEMWHPTIILEHTLSDQLQKMTSQRVKDFFTSEDRKYLVTSNEENLSTTFHTTNDFIYRYNLIELESEIINCAIEFSKNLSVNYEKFKIDSWINLFQTGQTEHAHTHYGNYLSGCYYVTSGNNSGKFVFPDPVPQRDMWKGIYLKDKIEENVLNTCSVGYEPTPGKILMFQSWMQHSVLKNNSEHPRISIAFNVNPIP